MYILIHHHNQDNEHRHHLQSFLVPFVILLSLPIPKPSGNIDLLEISFHFLEFYKNWITYCFLFVWLHSLRIILRFTHVVARQFPFTDEWYSIPLHGYTEISLFICHWRWVVSSLGPLQTKLLWTCTHKSLHGGVFSFLLDKYLGEEWLNQTAVYI